MKKIILLILSLFVFSCDSGGDSDLLSQLVGSWSISSYSVESEGVCEEDEEDDFDYVNNIYLVIDASRNWVLKDIETDDDIISGTFNETNKR